MKSLITSIVLITFIYLGFDKVSVWIILIWIILSQIFTYKNLVSVWLISLASFFLGYYIFLFDWSYFFENIFFLVISILLWVLYSSLEEGSFNIIPGVNIEIPETIRMPESSLAFCLVWLAFCFSIFISFPYLVDVFYNTSDFVIDKPFFALILLAFSIYRNYFLEEDFQTFLSTLIEEKRIEKDSLLSFFEGLNFIKTITSIVLIISISLNSRAYLNNFGDAFYNIKTIFDNKDSNIISEIIRILNEIFISLFF